MLKLLSIADGLLLLSAEPASGSQKNDGPMPYSNLKAEDLVWE